MLFRRMLANVSLWVAVFAGVAGGLTLAVWSSPTTAFSFSQASLISWRAGGDDVPANAATAGWAGPMFYTTAAEGAAPSGPEGRLATGKWAPGDSVGRALAVKNVDDTYMVRIEQMRVDLRGDMMLAPWLSLLVTGPSGQVLYQGRFADFQNGASLDLREPVLLTRRQQQELNFLVSMDRTVDNPYQGRSLQADFIMIARQFALPMVLDVHPSSWPNPINPGSSGDIPVAVNGTADLNVRQLVWSTARFGPGQAPPLRHSYEDWNRDGHTDLMLKFDTQASGFTCGMTEALLTIEDQAGAVYEDSDPIVTPPCRR